MCHLIELTTLDGSYDKLQLLLLPLPRTAISLFVAKLADHVRKQRCSTGRHHLGRCQRLGMKIDAARFDNENDKAVE